MADTRAKKKLKTSHLTDNDNDNVSTQSFEVTSSESTPTDSQQANTAVD